MAKLHYVKKARKAYRKHDIKKGQEYWWLKFRRLGKQYFKTKPRPSQCVRSDYQRALLSLQEDLEPTTDSLFSTAETVEEMVSLMQSSRDSVAEKFPNGCPTIDLLEERIEHCITLAQELRDAAEEMKEYETAKDEVLMADPPDVLANIGW